MKLARLLAAGILFLSFQAPTGPPAAACSMPCCHGGRMAACCPMNTTCAMHRCPVEAGSPASAASTGAPMLRRSLPALPGPLVADSPVGAASIFLPSPPGDTPDPPPRA